MTSAMESLRATIAELADCGFYGLPVKITLENGKRSIFPQQWAHLTSVEKWRESINGIIGSCGRGCNSIAVLTGISDLIVIDIDTTSDSKKKAGTELWSRLVYEFGEPNTLRAKTGSYGSHYYFSMSLSTRLTRTRNFSTMKVDGQTYGIDGRGHGGVIFCPPSSYTDEDGNPFSYEWTNGDPRAGCNAMPDWLIDIVNDQGGSSLPEPEYETMEPSAPPDTVPRSLLATPSPADGIVRAIKELLMEKAGDSTSRCGSTIDHGPFGTFYCFRVKGPRRCFLGAAHDGANNFNVLKLGRRVVYRCHGSICSKEKAKSLGMLPLEVALLDASSEPVDEISDDTVFDFRSMSLTEQNLLLRMVADNVLDNYTGLGRLFGFVYAKEGRILFAHAKRGYFWNGQQWMCDEGNKIQSTFCVQMAKLLKWYDRQRDALTKKKLVEKGLCDPDQSYTSIIATMRKRGGQNLVKEVEDLVNEELPKNKINVSSPKEARMCLDFSIGVLHEPELLSLMDRNIDIVNTPNGILDLRTGRLSPPHPSHMCSRSVGVRYMGQEYDTSRFTAFMMDIFNSEQGVVAWMQLFLGYSLTGHTSEEIFCIMYGQTGSNGKSALKQAITRAFGTYYTVMNKDCFIKSGGKRAEGAATSHIVQLKDTRLAMSDESEEKQQINGACIKEMSGGGMVTARELFQKPETFVPTHKSVLITNHKPDISEADEGLLRRLCLIPFVNTYKVAAEIDPNNPFHKLQDPTLKEFLESEEGARQTLVWCVNGAIEWYHRRELNPTAKVLQPLPKSLATAFNDYKLESDSLQQFINEYCETGPDCSVASADFLAHYVTQMSADIKPRALGMAMHKKNFKPMEVTIEGRRRRGFRGLKLKEILD
jgi:P4 family phage/plasmid primase-like protien